MNINFDNDIPIYIQLLNIIKKDIISGKYKIGEKLPSVREYALMFKVNPNTVQKSLQDLELSGLIYTERTNGKYITTNTKLIDRVKKDFANKLVNNYLDNMESIGFNKKQAINYLERNDN